MGETQDKIPELTEQIASILELPRDEQPEAFQRLRDEHPESHGFLIRCEDAALQLTPGCGFRASLVEAIADAGGDTMPDHIGPYEILDVLGEGGMGTVYLAEQKEPVHRRVALKVIKLGMATKEVIARFEAERQALARMSHPCIAHVIDVGTTAAGQAYLAMDHVPGLRITDYCDQHKLGLEERIALFQEVCLAVQHAHQKCVLHRDIKPSNILVATRDGKPVPMIIDFGVAKATDHSLTERSLYTEQGRLIGTPAYMSPEQAEKTGLEVDARADIYSLGVLLYELLTGFLPFPATELQQAGVREIRRRIREDEPPKPSTRLTTRTRGSDRDALASRLHSDPSALAEALRGDLDWITMRCLEKDPNRRYPSASGLAADLQRHLEHLPVDASPPSAAYRLRKFLRRRRGPVAAGMAMLLTLVVGLAIAIWQAEVADAADQAEATERKRAERALASYQRMKDAPLAADLVREAEHDFWPVHPAKVAAMNRWLAQARDLVGGVDGHVETVSELEKKARPPTPELARKLDELTSLEGQLDAKRNFRDKARAAATRSATARRRLPSIEREVRSLEARLERLDAETRETRWQFDDYEDRFLHGVFVDLVAKIDRLLGQAGLIAQVEARCKHAATLERRSFEDPKADWDRVLASVAASEKYAEMPAFTPQLGLVPLGTDPQSELEEFAVLDTGAVPARDAHGLLQIDGTTAIVLVLIPPGTFAMGAQSLDAQSPNYEPRAYSAMWPVHEVKLDAFFLSKYEMTQGQWRRVMNTNPSFFSPGEIVGGRTITAQNPVEYVSWYDCSEAMRRLGLVLPTEAQWEYGARAGTTTAWWPRQDKSSLGAAANTAPPNDRSAEERASGQMTLVVDLEDGHRVHAPVGSFRANLFGLHDVIGNVQEWCRDVRVDYGEAARPGDGLRADAGSTSRVQRGSCFSVTHTNTLLPMTHRSVAAAGFGSAVIGLRPSRVIHGR